jgi:hypothetical protein
VIKQRTKLSLVNTDARILRSVVEEYKIKHFHDEGSEANIRCGSQIFPRHIGL